MGRYVVWLLLGACRWHFDPIQDGVDGGEPDAFAQLDTSVDAGIPLRTYATSGATGSEQRLLEVSLATGAVTELGILGPTDILCGLAAWDGGTLYAASVAGDLYEITVAPPAAASVAAIGGVVSAFERDGADLIGVDETTDELIRFTPPTGTITRVPLTEGGAPLAAQGGDLVQLRDGRWRWWTNGASRLYELDVVTGEATALGAAQTGPFVAGMVRDDGDRLFITASNTDAIYELDPSTGAIIDQRPLCSPCPSTYNVLSGDATRASE